MESDCEEDELELDEDSEQRPELEWESENESELEEIASDEKYGEQRRRDFFLSRTVLIMTI